MSRTQIIKVVTGNGVIEVNFHDAADQIGRPQSVEIFEDGKLIAYESFDPACPFRVHPYSVAIWRRYEAIHRGNLVVRSGFGLCGCYENYRPDAPPNPRRPESDTEHASGCVELVRGLAAYYPHLLTPELFHRAEYLLKDHDLGENEYGDQPDDGSQNRSEKNQTELIGFVLASARWPAEIRATAISDFVAFQDPTFPGHPAEIAHLAQLTKVIDKFEAILSGVIYEKSGAKGDLAFKESHFSELTFQDRHFIHEAGDDASLVASWLAHAVHGYHAYYAFPYILDIVRAAVIDLRGAWFPWFDGFCRRNHIPETHISHPLA